MSTCATIHEAHGYTADKVEFPDIEIPVLTGPQRQGDVFVLPVTTTHDGAPIPAKGVTVVRSESNAANTHNLHGEAGPALTYADGYACHFWHGVAVPPDFYEWDITRALTEPNAEVRRCAIERIGWDTLTDRMTLVAEAPDPGNAPHTLRLYDLGGELADLYSSPARILVCHNASLDKGGHRRVFGLPVPAHHSDPVAAAADLFGVPVVAYRSLERAS